MPGRLRTPAAIATLWLASAGMLALPACGTRTGLLVPEPGLGDDGNGDGASDGGPTLTDATSPTDGSGVDVPVVGTFCSLYKGPVDSCDAGASAGPVQLCENQYSDCVKVFDPGTGVPYGLWGCCIHKPPENVPQCLARQLIDASCP
jgi:hypothetical protein